MADNSILPIPPGATNGDTIRDIDRGAGVKTQVVQLDIGGAASESLVTGAMPVTGTFWQATQPVSGTVAATQSGAWAVSLSAGAALVGTVKIGDGTNTITLDQNNTDGEPATEFTVPVEGYGMVFNGTTWDRIRGDTTAGMWVQVKAALPAGANTIGAVNLAQYTPVTGRLPVDGSGVTQPVSIAASVTVQQATAANLNAQVQGTAASGAAKSGNPVQVGGVFNTTQPTVTTGQVVEAQMTARGARIVATGVDAFNIGSIAGAITPGTGATNLGKAIRSGAAASADAGVAVAFVRNDDAATAIGGAANGNYGHPAVDLNGAQYVRGRVVTTYSAAYRLADATAGQLSLTFTFAANTNKQLATIYHTGAATKTVRIRKISLIVSTGALGVFNFEVRALSATTAPATGNPAITPRAHTGASAAAEAACLALPTTAGSLVGANTGTVGIPVEWNSVAAAGTANPSGLAGQEIILYQFDAMREAQPLIMRAATAEGFAINGRCTTAVALRYMVYIEFTEE